jgi:RNase P subunit RPR2
MKSDLTKQEINNYIKNVFLKQSSPTEIKKAKKLAMSRNIKLGELRKKFCKKCYSIFDSKNSEIRIRKGFKIVKCKNCSNISRYKLKN